MLTLAPGCACDVCAEEYGPHRLPHSIPCGHVLCASCCTTIVEKTSARLSPACPFCREHFTSDSMRLIRMDFTTSGWSTPRRFPAMETLTDSLMTSEMLQRKTAHLMSGSKARIEVKRLEEKVARVAAKKCSVEEVSSLYKELEEWLIAEKDDQTSSLFLSAALLRAILMNHLAHSDASKAAKTTEANLKNKVEDLEQQSGKLDAEVRRQRSQYNQKSQECQQLRTEVQQLRALATTLGVTPPEFAPVPTSPTPAPEPVSQSTQYTSASAAANRFHPSLHTRSASMSASVSSSASRPTTPAGPISPTRSHTPAVSPLRSHTPASPSFSSPQSQEKEKERRPYTPGPGPSLASAAAEAHKLRSQTPGPRSHTPAASLSSRAQTPGPTHYTSASHYAQQQAAAAAAANANAAPPVPQIPSRYTQTPAPSQMYRGVGAAATGPIIPPKPRRLSTPSPPKMSVRSTSEEKYGSYAHGQPQHQVWMPSQPAGDDDYVIRSSDRREEKEKERYGATLTRSSTTRPPSRNGFSSFFKR